MRRRARQWSAAAESEHEVEYEEESAAMASVFYMASVEEIYVFCVLSHCPYFCPFDQ